MNFRESNILHTHLKNGALQGTIVLIKNELELLEGYKTINYYKELILRDGTFQSYNVGKEVYFKKGWYNNKLELIENFTIQDQIEINQLLPF